MVICREQGANDLHMVQHATATPSSLLQQNPERFILLVPAYPGCPGKRPLNDCVCVCVCVCVYVKQQRMRNDFNTLMVKTQY